MLKIVVTFCALLFGIVEANTSVLALAGSTREDSVNKKLAIETADIARQLGAEVTYIDLKDYSIPFYDADIEKKGMPTHAIQLRKLMIESDVIVIASPEYNASISAVLKNAIDWVSRNENAGSSQDAFKGKTVILMSASPGNGGGARGLNHLQTVIDSIGGQGTVFPKQIHVPNAYAAFNENGKLINAEKFTELQNLLEQILRK